jgi:flavin-dependent dehydrogenase
MVVAIVGASVAGASLAWCLAKRGIEVVVYDKAVFPRRKACGEGLLPPGVEALRDMGLTPPEFPRVRGLRFVSGGESIEADFPAGHGLVVRRETFDAWLVAQARSAGAVIHEGTPAPDLDADVIVAADGIHSRYANGVPDEPRRIGFSTHADRIETGGRVEVRVLDDGELYLAPGGLAAALIRAERYDRVDPFRQLGLSIAPTTPVLAMAPLGLEVREIVRGNLLLIGDAAGAPDPITGEGMSLALRSALAAADAIARGRLEEYALWRREEGDAARRFGRLLLAMGRRASTFVPRLRRRPEVLAQLVEVAVGRRRLASLPIKTWLKLVAG